LLISKRIDDRASKHNRPDRCLLAQKWNSERRPVTEPFREGASFGKLLCLGLEVEHVDRLTLKNGAGRDVPTHAG